MSDIYVFGPKEEDNDYSTMGLVGALTPTECTFSETANGESGVTLTHPLDEFGRYLALERGNILVVPVPVRTTPEIQNGSCVTTVWTYTVKPLDQLTSKNQRTLYKKKTGSGKIKIMPAGTKMTVVQKYEDEDARWKVKTQYGTGWVMTDGIELVTEHIISDNSAAIEEIESPWTVRDQYFRIYETSKSMTDVKVTARHISYDLLYNQSKLYNETSLTLQEALDATLGDVYAEHEFSAYTNVANEQSGLFYRNRNPIDIFLNEDDGLCTRYDVGIVRDNYELYFLHDPGINRGVRIQYGKNMTGIEYTISDDEIATRIVPIGEKKDGTPLYLADDNADNAQCVDSPNIDLYPVIHVYELSCENCKVGDKDDDGGTVTTAIARARMLQQAQDLLETGCDEPKIEIDVEFINLGDTEEYKQFKNLENCFLFDYITVQHPNLDIDVTARIVSIEWDCLLDHMNKATVGSVGKTLTNTGICTWQIPSGFSGSKIASGTIGSGALMNNIISVRHMQADSVNAAALQAQSITTNKLAAGSVTAEKLAVGAVDAQSIRAISAKISALTAEDITTDSLAAGLAAFTVLTCGTAEFDRATVAHLVANAMNLEFGTADEVFIRNLSVEYAQMVGAAIGNLCIKASDGNYYAIDVDESGNVIATNATLTEDEISAGETESGRVILETSITAESLNTANLLATYALINRIDAARIDVDTLLAREAFISKLITSQIFADGSSLEIVAAATNEMQKWFKFTNDRGLIIRKLEYTDEEGTVHPASIWYTATDETGYHIYNTQQTAAVGSFQRGGLKTTGVEIGEIACKRTTSGGWVWTDAE